MHRVGLLDSMGLLPMLRIMTWKFKKVSGLLDEHQRRSKVSEATAIRSSDSLRRRRTGIMIFLELMASESFKGATNIERNGIKGSDLMVFSFATIVAATINLQVRISLDKEIDQLSMILSTISDASRLRTSCS
ncbi:hypothetical protein Tco_0489661 [Tanacetum coccineum]